MRKPVVAHGGEFQVHGIGDLIQTLLTHALVASGGQPVVFGEDADARRGQ